MSLKEFMLAGELALVAVSAGMFPAGVLADEAPAQTEAPVISNERAPASTAENETAIAPETDAFLKNAGTQVDKAFEEGSKGE